MSFNKAVFEALFSLANSSKLASSISVFLAEQLPYLLGAVFFWLLFSVKSPKKQIYYLCLVSLSILLSWGVIAETIKFIYYSERPFEALGFKPLIEPLTSGSIPSNHVSFLIPLALTALLIDKKRGWLFLTGVLLVGIGRIMVGVHWPFDILAGIAVGLIGFCIVKKFLVPRLDK